MVGGEPFVISHPGEYEVKGVFVYGIAALEKETTPTVPRQTIYRLEIGDMRIAHLGALTVVPREAIIERLADCDILLLPVGGRGVALGAREAVDLIASLEPRVVIPTCFALPGLKVALDPVEKFVKESGLTPETLERVKITKKDLPSEETTLYILRA